MGKVKDYLFRFKKFNVRHGNSSMRVGIDAVLLGAWAVPGGECNRIIDVGTGCGVIALMMAQRFPYARIDAIDVDANSIDEASYNFKESSWHDRLSAINISFNELYENVDGSANRYDLIISNPPYFDSGVRNIDNSRLQARHQSSLSPHILAEHAYKLLAPTGRLAMILPSGMGADVVNIAETRGHLKLTRKMIVRGNAESLPKRVLLEFRLNETIESGFSGKDIKGSDYDSVECDLLIIEHSHNDYTAEYIALTKDFYLKF